VITAAFSHEIDTVRAAAAEVAEERYRPRAAGWEREHTLFPAEERSFLGSLGYLGIVAAEEYGGSNRPLMEALVVLEEFGKRNMAAAFQIFEANTGPIRVVGLYGTPEQRQKYVREVVAGSATMSVAISEPEAGSAASDLTTVARVSGGYVHINGIKRWCSGAGHSEYYLVFARMISEAGDDAGQRVPGIAAIIIHKDDVGVSFGRRENLHGFHSVATADIFLDSVRVPMRRILDAQFRDLMSAFCIERIGNATMSLAIAQASFDLASSYVASRRQFGRAIMDFQAVHTALARQAVELQAARLLVYSAAQECDETSGLPSPLQSSMAKWKANKVAVELSQAAMELMGGYGYHTDYEIERLHRDAHGWAIAGGTATMQELRIASELFNRKFSQRPERPATTQRTSPPSRAAD
jgi:alkylation response protein AidB-like acyl-CoA dehydrogenase